MRKGIRRKAGVDTLKEIKKQTNYIWDPVGFSLSAFKFPPFAPNGATVCAEAHLGAKLAVKYKVRLPYELVVSSKS
jgi:hypothetical protein